VLKALQANLLGVNRYPITMGSLELRDAIARWLQTRYSLAPGGIDPATQILSVNGTREGIFAFTQSHIDPTCAPFVVSCNPFYQIYEGAALLAGAEPWYLDCLAENNFVPDLDSVPAAVWQRCQLLHLCSPGNPTGAVMSIKAMQRAIELAHTYDFTIVSDECYAEVYLDEMQPPPGLLQAATEAGHHDFKRCLVFHSLSKRSNLPGLRSGFVAGDRSLIETFMRYRTYHGCAMSPLVQAASIAAWNDEEHVIQNRQLYRDKFAAVTQILAPALEFPKPEASFYLWPKTPIDDVTFSRSLFNAQHITVLPGQYMSRISNASNPGENRIRLALVADITECIQAAERIARHVRTL
jgi:N-succinyldiaminopimelate aminotransferase